VAELAHAERPRRAAGRSGRRRAAGIYGTIITAAVIAATGVRLTTVALAGRAAQVDRKRLFMITSVAAALGVMMIILKDVVLIHLH
jgi:hypothetical protein